MFMSDHCKTLAEAADAECYVFDSSADFPDRTFDVPILQDEIVEEDRTWDLSHLTSKDDRASSALQRIKELCRFLGLSVPFNVQHVQKVVKDSLAALVSAGDDDASLAVQKKCNAAEKTDLQQCLAASEE